jgi:hypothetical protein
VFRVCPDGHGGCLVSCESYHRSDLLVWCFPLYAFMRLLLWNLRSFCIILGIGLNIINSLPKITSNMKQVNTTIIIFNFSVQINMWSRLMFCSRDATKSEREFEFESSILPIMGRNRETSEGARIVKIRALKGKRIGRGRGRAVIH